MAATKKRKSVYETNPLYAGRSTCRCVAKIDRRLKALDVNTQIVTSLFTNHVAVATIKADDGDRRKPAKVMARYCPFCGVKYPESKKKAAS